MRLFWKLGASRHRYGVCDKHHQADGSAFGGAADKGEVEGVVAKRLYGPYLEGQRALVKVKRSRTETSDVFSLADLVERRDKSVTGLVFTF